MAAATPREVAAGADVVFICVADTPDVEQVILGTQGLIHSLRPGAVIVDVGIHRLPPAPGGKGLKARGRRIHGLHTL